ncbi:hypothetical protein IH970_15150 [candidate division KSB1 bacterium]|nr:hypothetical protein [candidate division KSB1 bacterium]
MEKYEHEGVSAFGNDRGTFWRIFWEPAQNLDLPSLDPKRDRRRLLNAARNRPIIWFVDDELGNREWFRDFHKEDFSVVTFSSRAHFKKALADGFPCDAIVTDIFFPAETVETEEAASKLLYLFIYIPYSE